VADLLVHLRLDAEALLYGLAVPCDDAIDRDFISYWKDWPSPVQTRLQRVRDEVAGHMVALRPFCPYIALEARFNR
jgi:hypothetical protein